MTASQGALPANPSISASAATLTAAQLIAAFGLPARTMVGQRVPKKMLAENGAASAADRKLLQEQIEEITWVAALKPANVGVAEYRDEQRSYLELAVLSLTLRQDKAGKPVNLVRIAELVHRAIPYPVLLLLANGPRLCFSLVHIRWAQKEIDKTVLDGDMVQALFEPAKSDREAIAASQDSSNVQAFLAAVELSRQPQANLFELYQGWQDQLSAWQASAVTGHFEANATPAQAAQRRKALHLCLDLDAQIAGLRSAAAKEKQMARQVAANLKIRTLIAERQQVASSI